MDLMRQDHPLDPVTYAAQGDPFLETLPILTGLLSSDLAASMRAIWSDSTKAPSKARHLAARPGGGIMATGADNQTMFVDMTLESLRNGRTQMSPVSPSAW